MFKLGDKVKCVRKEDVWLGDMTDNICGYSVSLEINQIYIIREVFNNNDFGQMVQVEYPDGNIMGCWYKSCAFVSLNKANSNIKFVELK